MTQASASADRQPTGAEARQSFFASHHPFAILAQAQRVALSEASATKAYPDGGTVYAPGDRLEGLYAIATGDVRIFTAEGDPVSHLRIGECFGERGLLMDGTAPYSAEADPGTVLHLMPAERFLALMAEEPRFALFFGRAPLAERRDGEAAGAPPGAAQRIQRVADLMTPRPLTLAPSAPVADAARLMSDKGISCVLVAEGNSLSGLVTASDLCARVLAAGRDPATPLAEVMTAAPLSLGSEALTLDALALMAERSIGHLPVVDRGRLVGVLTRTDLLMQSALSSPMLIGEINKGERIEDLAATLAKLPELLAQLVGSGLSHWSVTRLTTDLADALTRRLIEIAEARLGPPPVPYLWAVCGSQGRREQTGVSDQDNCLILHEDATPEHEPYFEGLARTVADGLNDCGYVYCPGDMMAINPRWRQPLPVWRRYFRGWIAKPDPEARMLASVMFDLRAVAGDASLLGALQAETLAAARANSIFIAHMVANSLGHQPPLGLFRGFALTRSGEHKGSLDMKHAGVVPVVDLARLYALMGGLAPVNTRDRLLAATEAGIISESGGRDLIDAYDLIAEMRLEHQAAQIRRGARPDNFLIPAELSDLQRSHLRNAFVVVKTMQSAAAQGRHTVV